MRTPERAFEDMTRLYLGRTAEAFVVEVLEIFLEAEDDVCHVD